MHDFTRRHFVAALTGTTVATGLWGAHSAAAAAPAAGASAGGAVGATDRCLANCQACEQACRQTLSYCLQQGGAHTHPEHVQSLVDCAEMCRNSATMMMNGSPLHPQVCGVCAAACAACATSCAAFGADPTMAACVAACETCRDSCDEMASTGH